MGIVLFGVIMYYIFLLRNESNSVKETKLLEVNEREDKFNGRW